MVLHSADRGVLPEISIPKESRRQRITGSQVYSFFRCEHSVYLQFFGDPKRRLPDSPALELLFARGLEHERRIVASLDYAEPAFAEHDYEAGARATFGLMQEGVQGISQAVLFESPYLGIPDLLRRCEGESRFGSYHYVVGDIKSSYRSRSDQALQLSFYSQLLARVQGRTPTSAYLILRDGREERVDLTALEPVLQEILEELNDLLTGKTCSRPHRSRSCRSCPWRELCAESPAVYWLPGLTRSVREIIQEAGYEDVQDIAELDPKALASKGLLPEATWQRARWSALACQEQRALRVREPRTKELGPAASPVLILRDGFDQRFLLFGSLAPAGEPRLHLALDASQEDDAFRSFLAELRSTAVLCHAGGFSSILYHFSMRCPDLVEEIQATQKRSTDLMSIVKGAYVFPAPVEQPEEALAWIRGESTAEEVDALTLFLEGGDPEILLDAASRRLLAMQGLLETLVARV